MSHSWDKNEKWNKAKKTHRKQYGHACEHSSSGKQVFIVCAEGWLLLLVLWPEGVLCRPHVSEVCGDKSGSACLVYVWVMVTPCWGVAYTWEAWGRKCLYSGLHKTAQESQRSDAELSSQWGKLNQATVFILSTHTCLPVWAGCMNRVDSASSHGVGSGHTLATDIYSYWKNLQMILVSKCSNPPVGPCWLSEWEAVLVSFCQPDTIWNSGSQPS